MPKLTPAERRELKKQKKIEKKRQKEEHKKQVKRDHLSREVQYGSYNIKKHEKDWRSMLIKVTLPRMRQELEVAWHNFERLVDSKDFTISLLMDELRDSEEQYMRNFRHHLENVDDLIVIFTDRMEELKVDYHDEVKKMEERCLEETEGVKEDASDNFNYLKTMLHKLELDKKDQEKTKRNEYYSRLDEVDVKNQLLIQKLKANLEKKYQTIFDKMEQFVHDYNKQIRDRKKEHQVLKSADDAIQELIRQQFGHIRKLNDVIQQLKQKQNDVRQIEGSRLQDLQSEKQYFAKSRLALKTKLEDEKNQDFKNLKCVSRSSAATFNCLELLNTKGEKILRLATVCRKLETQKEKILAFPACTMERVKMKSGDDDDDNKLVTKEMELFWQRVGMVHSIHYSLDREKRFLKEENEIFIDTHNDYCEKLMYPEKKDFNPTGTINKTDANFAMQKYYKSEINP